MNMTNKDLLYYISRSFFRDGDQVINLVAEEAEQGNELAIRALEARRESLQRVQKYEADIRTEKEK